jgi:Fe2+ or Zn2+ uptake regulation protein
MQVFIDYLQSHKLKLTPHRELILESFLNNEGTAALKISIAP